LIELVKNQVNISERTLQRAKERVGIVATKTGFDNPMSMAVLVQPQ
jgi:hypothetical protein